MIGHTTLQSSFVLQLSAASAVPARRRVANSGFVGFMAVIVMIVIR